MMTTMMMMVMMKTCMAAGNNGNADETQVGELVRNKGVGKLLKLINLGF
jgi:hypothetical protein